METNGSKNNISTGLIISNDQLMNNPIFPQEIKAEITNAPYYLLIFIYREDVVKINCFQIQSDSIKKILIKLTEFSPDVVKGISTALRDLKLSKDIIHTTGLCYEMEECFYETYVSADAFASESLTESIKKNFSSISKVISVSIEDVLHS